MCQHGFSMDIEGRNLGRRRRTAIPLVRSLNREPHRSEFWANRPSDSNMKRWAIACHQKVVKTSDTQNSVFTYHGPSFAKTAVLEYSKSVPNTENA
jgi:hypothetical protein